MVGTDIMIAIFELPQNNPHLEDPQFLVVRHLVSRSGYITSLAQAAFYCNRTDYHRWSRVSFHFVKVGRYFRDDSRAEVIDRIVSSSPSPPFFTRLSISNGRGRRSACEGGEGKSLSFWRLWCVWVITYRGGVTCVPHSDAAPIQRI